jgi:hypothetical protein
VRGLCIEVPPFFWNPCFDAPVYPPLPTAVGLTWIGMEDGIHMTDSDPMRVHLTVPFADKDEAKKHEARWGAIRKTWWINRDDIATDPAINRWIVGDPALATKAKAAADFLSGEAASNLWRQRIHAPVSSRRKDFSLPDCSCVSPPPWEHCAHSIVEPPWQPG